MISLPIHDKTGQQVGTYEFDENELAEKINKQLLHDAVVMYQSNLRLGTARTKSRGEIAGSTKKLFKQKGTGRARMGNKRTGIRRGGGHIHAKRPRDFSYRMPRKALMLATRMALLSKFQDGQVTVLNELAMAQPKTKEIATMLKALGVAEKSCLLAVKGYEPTIVKSVRNIPSVEILPCGDLNSYLLLRQRQLVVTKDALDVLRNKAGQQRKVIRQPAVAAN